MSDEERSAFLSHLGVELEKELPKGQRWPLLRMIAVLERGAWRALTPRFRRILETAITKDVLFGRLDSSRNRSFQSEGSMGIYAKSLWPYFSKPHDVANNIISSLHMSEQTQNYVGEYLLSILPALAERTHTTDPIIRALKAAVENKAKFVIDGLVRLPEDWVAKIKPKKG